MPLVKFNPNNNSNSNSNSNSRLEVVYPVRMYSSNNRLKGI